MQNFLRTLALVFTAAALITIIQFFIAWAIEMPQPELYEFPTLDPVARGFCTLNFVDCERETVSGEASWLRYELNDSCAALLWPKGTRLLVTAGDKSIVCVRRDSGPYVKGRIIDLNREQFAELANPGRGLIEVSVKPL